LILEQPTERDVFNAALAICERRIECIKESVRKQH
jgi:hypothetical protein